MGLAEKINHNEYVKTIHQELSEKVKYFIQPNFDYISTVGPSEVDLLVLKNNRDAYFIEVKSKHSGGNLIRAIEGYQKFQATFYDLTTSGIYISPSIVGNLDDMVFAKTNPKDAVNFILTQLH